MIHLRSSGLSKGRPLGLGSVMVCGILSLPKCGVQKKVVHEDYYLKQAVRNKENMAGENETVCLIFGQCSSSNEDLKSQFSYDPYFTII